MSRSKNNKTAGLKLHKSINRNFRHTYRIFLFVLLFTFYSTGIPASKNYNKEYFRYIPVITKQELTEKIDSIVSTINCNVSIKIASASKYDLIYEYNPDAEMIPASITKIITACTALDKLGTGYTFNTVIFTDDNNLSDGIVNGNLYLKGYGDPDLEYADLVYLTKQLSEKNIKEVTGNIIYDESFLDNKYYGLADYYKNDTKFSNWPYVSAINLDKNKGGYDPAYSAAKVIADELTKYEIKFQGIIISGVTPQVPNEICRISRPLFDVLKNMNKTSDNMSAIAVFKVTGAVFKSVPGTMSKGGEAVIDFLSSTGISRNKYEIIEGSGLSRYNMVTSGSLIQLLKYMYDQEKLFDYFLYSLAIAGVDGTLKDRMKNTEAEKNVYAKTGTLNSVSTLAGYSITRDNELMIFYITMNGFSGNALNIRKKQDTMCEIICSFSRN